MNDSAPRPPRTYEQRCLDAATGQGLDPMTALLTREGIQHEVEQTGGFTMVISVPVKDGTVCITQDGRSPGRPWLVCVYDGDDWVEGLEARSDHFDQSDADVLGIIRAES